MNAYVMSEDGAHVIEGVDSLEVHPNQVALIRGGGGAGQLLAAVKLSDSVWVAIGDRPPAATPASPRPVRSAERDPVLVGDGGWPPEPPPDVDSEG
jgi:hypothetical protein